MVRHNLSGADVRLKKRWLDGLPAGTKLELVAVTADGHELADVRERIKTIAAEIATLKRARAPSNDIEVRVKHYLRRLAPKVSGVGVGERLSIIWPGAQASSGYISEHTCDPLALLAALFPDWMLALVKGARAAHQRGRDDDLLPFEQPENTPLELQNARKKDAPTGPHHTDVPCALFITTLADRAV
jgi:hypothetical protein